MSENQKTVAEEAATTTKNVTVFSTRDNAMTEIPNSSATTWGELQKELKEFQVDFSGMKVIVGETRNTLEADIALVPETDYTLYLYPVKIKAGSERSDLFEKIKAWVGNDADRKKKFIIDGKNMTQISTPVLVQLWAEHGDETVPAVASPKAVPTPKAPAAPKEEVKPELPKTPATTVKEAAIANTVAALGSSKIKDVIVAAKELAATMSEDIDEEFFEDSEEEEIVSKVKDYYDELNKIIALLDQAAVPTSANSVAPPPVVLTEAQIAEAAEKKRVADKKAALMNDAKTLKNKLQGIQ